MADVDPFTPGPSFEELAQQQIGEEFRYRLPHDCVAPDGTTVPEGTPVTIEQAAQLGIHLVIGVR